MDRPHILFLDDFEHLFAHSPEVMAFSDRALLEIHTEPLRGEALSLKEFLEIGKQLVKHNSTPLDT
jgi:hypothetical protein